MATEKSNGNGGWVSLWVALIVAATLFVPLPTGWPLTRDLPPVPTEHWAGMAALGLAFLAFWMFRRRFWPRDHRECHRVRNALLLVALQAALFRTTVELLDMAAGRGATAWLWPTEAWLWMPWFLVIGLSTILLGGRAAHLVSLAGALFLILRADPGPLALTGYLLAGVVGINSLRRAPTRSRVIRAALLTGWVLGLAGGVSGLMVQAPMDRVATQFLLPLLMGLISGFLVLTLLPLMEWVLGEMSDVTLVEYGSDHPLLDQLKEQAPGTWHHTLNVSDLAEKAAAAIGARALFCKTAAYFHDIGKLRDPDIFAENIDGPSPHEALPPEESARRIIEHVTHGLELARKHRLPRPFREIIAEHHGVSVVRYFFARACESLDPDTDPDTVRSRFTYPGPAPSTRESGIIALADAVEAATRSMGPQSEAGWRATVRKLLADRILEGELADCPLTLAELARVEESFVRWLKACHHHRPTYPRPRPTVPSAGSGTASAHRSGGRVLPGPEPRPEPVRPEVRPPSTAAGVRLAAREGRSSGRGDSLDPVESGGAERGADPAEARGGSRAGYVPLREPQAAVVAERVGMDA